MRKTRRFREELDKKAEIGFSLTPPTESNIQDALEDQGIEVNDDNLDIAYDIVDRLATCYLLVMGKTFESAWDEGHGYKDDLTGGILFRTDKDYPLLTNSGNFEDIEEQDEDQFYIQFNYEVVQDILKEGSRKVEKNFDYDMFSAVLYAGWTLEFFDVPGEYLRNFGVDV